MKKDFGLFNLQYADGDVELSVPRRRIREQNKSLLLEMWWRSTVVGGKGVRVVDRGSNESSCRWYHIIRRETYNTRDQMDLRRKSHRDYWTEVQ